MINRDWHDRWHTLMHAHRRAMTTAAVVGVVTVSFGAGALAMKGTNDAGSDSSVKVENIGNTALATTTTEAPTTTTTEAPTTTTAVAPTTTVPPTTAPPTTAPPTTKPKPPAAPTYTFEAPGAGTMTVKLENGMLSIVGTNAYPGWTAEIHTDKGTEYVKTVFRQGNVVKYVKARLKNGTVVPETGEWTECNTTPAPGTNTFELSGVGSMSVSWNGSSFTLDAVTPAAGWVVANQETPGNYVRVYFAPAPPASEVGGQTGGGDDGSRWMKVKIENCEIQQYSN